MRTSAHGQELIKKHEGLRLKAYKCSAGVWTIGYGHTKGVKKGDVISQQQAEIFLVEDLSDAERAVARLVTAPINQNQFDALASFTFNLGAGALAESTLLKKFNAGDTRGAADQFKRWVHANGVVLEGLEDRRRDERNLFLAGQIAPESISVSTPTPQEEKPVAPFIAAALPAIMSAVPELIKMFGDGPKSEVAERNIKAAEAVVKIAQEVTATPNAQAAAEAIQASPEVAATVREAVKERWYELEEVAGGIAAAREANAAAPIVPRLGVRFHELLTLLVVTGSYGIGGAYLFTGEPAPEMAAALVTALVISALGAIVGYWFGSTSGSALKSELLARK